MDKKIIIAMAVATIAAERGSNANQAKVISFKKIDEVQEEDK